jgi:transcriptional regulator with XRE-family HTH domain
MIQGDRLRQRREQRGLSQGKLRGLIGKDGQYIWKLESGMRSGVNSTTLIRMAQALETSSDYLLGLSDRATPARVKATPRAASRLQTDVPQETHDQVAPTPAPAQISAADAWTPRLCPRCGIAMRRIDEGPEEQCPACHYHTAIGHNLNHGATTKKDTDGQYEICTT